MATFLLPSSLLRGTLYLVRSVKKASDGPQMLKRIKLSQREAKGRGSKWGCDLGWQNTSPGTRVNTLWTAEPLCSPWSSHHLSQTSPPERSTIPLRQHLLLSWNGLEFFCCCGWHLITLEAGLFQGKGCLEKTHNRLCVFLLSQPC